MAVRYLDESRMNALDEVMFQSNEPYPWVNPENLLTDDGYRELAENLPDVALFDRVFGKQRKFGQQSHDRYVLEYDPGLSLPPAWKNFLGELQGPIYRSFLRRMFGHDAFSLRYHWHYTPNGCSVSPHCDSKHKLGSHIFYLNSPENWQTEWGGETLILDDHGRFPSSSNPAFEDFDRVVGAEALGNWSLLFHRRGNSWHGVREIRCPDDALRKVFIVVVERRSALDGARARVQAWMR